MRLGLPEDIIPTVRISKYESNGIFKRLYNSIEAISRQSDVNHITGDVHYLDLFFKDEKNSAYSDGLRTVKSIKRNRNLNCFTFFGFNYLQQKKHLYNYHIYSHQKRSFELYVKI